MQRHGDGLRHHGGLIGKILRQLVEQAAGQGGRLRKAAITNLAHETEAGAEVMIARPTGRAVAAPEAGVGHHPVARREIGDLRTQRRDAADQLMARHRGAAADPLAGAEIMEVGAADAGGGDGEVHPAGLRCGGCGDLLDAEITLGMEPDGLHGKCSLQIEARNPPSTGKHCPVT